jgi:serine palmitoyltransferase
VARQASTAPSVRKEGALRSASLTLPADVHLELERAIARYLQVPACIIYAQAFSTSSSVIPSFSKRGDIIVADRAINFSIQKGIQISRSTVRWYDHNDMDSLQAVLESIARDDRKYRRPLTRRFIITEALFECDGSLLDLPRVVRALT